MKKITLSIIMAFIGALAYAQNGLECIVVEKYYVSNAADGTASIGILPIGSATYRVYADMLPGYKFQLAFGSESHPLNISTTTTFFNNEDRGATTPTYTKTQAKANTVMLDSWLSAGAGCSGNFGILKSADNGVATVINSDGACQNNDASAGIPLTTQDGLIIVSGKTPGSVTFLPGFDLSAIDGTSQAGNSVSTNSSGWSCLAGAMGPDSATNMVLIGQFTTDGILSFHLNLQIGTPGGATEVYTALPAGTDTTTLACLTFASNTVGVNNPEASTPSLKIYPNPTKEAIYLEIISSGKSVDNSYSVYGVAGNLITRKKLGMSAGKYIEHVDMSSLAAGIYIIELSVDGSSSWQKVIKN